MSTQKAPQKNPRSSNACFFSRGGLFVQDKVHVHFVTVRWENDDKRSRKLPSSDQASRKKEKKWWVLFSLSFLSAMQSSREGKDKDSRRNIVANNLPGRSSSAFSFSILPLKENILLMVHWFEKLSDGRQNCQDKMGGDSLGSRQGQKKGSLSFAIGYIGNNGGCKYGRKVVDD